MRDRDNFVSESAVTTNKLIIRLDKLVNQCPTDTSKRRGLKAFPVISADFEREVVPWGPDSESSNCTTCAAKFSLTR